MNVSLDRFRFRIPRWAGLAAAAALIVALAPGVSHAQLEKKSSFGFGGGVVPTLGDIDKYLDPGWNMFFRAGYKINPRWRVNFEYFYNGLNIDHSVYNDPRVKQIADSLNGIGFNSHMWGMTLSPELRVFGQDHEITGYVTAGVGYYSRTVEVTSPGVAYLPPYWDPWWGWMGGGFGTVDYIIGEHTSTAVGANAGFGVSLPIDYEAEMFIEVRYHRAWTSPSETEIIPVTFGLRW